MTATTPDETTVQLHKALEAAVGLSADDISNVQSLMDVGDLHQLSTRPGRRQGIRPFRGRPQSVEDLLRLREWARPRAWPTDAIQILHLAWEVKSLGLM